MSLHPVYEEIDKKVSQSLLQSITAGLSDVIGATLQKILDNVRDFSSSTDVDVILQILHIFIADECRCLTCLELSLRTQNCAR